MGGTQRLVAGAYLGFDTPRNLGGYAYGGTIAAPIIKSMIEKSRNRWSDLPAVAPEGIRMVRIDRRTGTRVFTEPSLSTRADQIAARRAEYLSLIAAGRYGDSATREVGMPENFAEESGGIY